MLSRSLETPDISDILVFFCGFTSAASYGDGSSRLLDSSSDLMGVEVTYPGTGLDMSDFSDFSDFMVLSTF